MIVHLRSEQEELERLIRYHTEAIEQYRKRKDVVTKAISEIEEDLNIRKEGIEECIKSNSAGGNEI